MIQFNLSSSTSSLGSASRDILFMRKNEFPAILNPPPESKVFGRIMRIHGVVQKDFAVQEFACFNGLGDPGVGRRDDGS